VSHRQPYHAHGQGDRFRRLRRHREAETEVGDFETTNALLGKTGYIRKACWEKRRHASSLGGARLEIDTRPCISAYLYIEADCRAEVVRVASLLRCTEAELTGENTTKVCDRYGMDLSTIVDLRFDAK
jgi:adenylate cyclase class 2